MADPMSFKLKKLFKYTDSFLTSYKNEEQRKSLYLVACKLSEQYRMLYQQNPNALQAQLTLFNPSYDFATNLVVSQCVLTTAFCVSQEYDNSLSDLYISVSLIENLCVAKQLNKLSSHGNFNEIDKKIWRLRHQLAAKILADNGNLVSPIIQILAKLTKYKQALVNTPKIMLYDNGITLVTLANIIAMNITCNSTDKNINLYQALGDLYLRTPNLFAQRVIKALIAHIGPFLPASKIVYSEQSMIYLTTDTQQRHVIVNLDNPNKVVWYRVKASLKDDAKQWRCTDPRLHLNVWDSEHVNVKAATLLNYPQVLLNLISQIKLKHEYSYKGLSAILSSHPHIIAKLCEAVKPYNKEHKAAQNLKHSLSMAGYVNVPAIIQRVIFEELVHVTPHPLHHFALNRLTSLVNIMALLVSKTKHLQFEHIVLPLYAYAYYLLTRCSTRVSRKIHLNAIQNKTLSAPFCVFFGVECVDNNNLNKQITQLLHDNPWTDALLESEQLPKKQLTHNHYLWVSLKVVAQIVFKPDVKLSPWQKQIFNEQLKVLGWGNKSVFFTQLQTLGLSNRI